mmetsp:Transcript_10605/g.35968  ORF Transcript_10605/g.35968 Transcript_10605/m.35968 type:complete len:313 (+) Transcript_10605:3655-4593(+)
MKAIRNVLAACGPSPCRAASATAPCHLPHIPPAGRGRPTSAELVVRAADRAVARNPAGERALHGRRAIVVARPKRQCAPSARQGLGRAGGAPFVRAGGWSRRRGGGGGRRTPGRLLERLRELVVLAGDLALQIGELAASRGHLVRDLELLVNLRGDAVVRVHLLGGADHLVRDGLGLWDKLLLLGEVHNLLVSAENGLAGGLGDLAHLPLSGGEVRAQAREDARGEHVVEDVHAEERAEDGHRRGRLLIDGLRAAAVGVVRHHHSPAGAHRDGDADVADGTERREGGGPRGHDAVRISAGDERSQGKRADHG